MFYKYFSQLDGQSFNVDTVDVYLFSLLVDVVCTWSDAFTSGLGGRAGILQTLRWTEQLEEDRWASAGSAGVRDSGFGWRLLRAKAQMVNALDIRGRGLDSLGAIRVISHPLGASQSREGTKSQENEVAQSL